MSTFKKILVPTDFSAAAWHAVQLSLSIISSVNAEITLLHVFPYAAKFDSREGDLNEEDLEAITTIKQEMEDFINVLAPEKNIIMKPQVVAGGVESEILKIIFKEDFDLVIMGVNSSGRDNQPGSHVANIIEKATIPVLVVPNYPSPKQNQSA